ncbi:MAG TPA: sodium/solute symporter [Bryobacteraceae bacterium]|nr:sodium/solute symporter [Bryobacteraceae bacterium]
MSPGFSLVPLDYVAFLSYFVVLCGIGYMAGRRKKKNAEDYFLAGRSLPWYVVGTSFVAANISTEQFIGMVGAAYVFGICVAMADWGNIYSFSLLIWFFIPFLLASRIFTTPEFLEKRYNLTVRHFFAAVTVLSNITAFLAGVLYGGGLALQRLFGWELWVSVLSIAVAAGIWAIYGGLVSIAWTDLFTLIIKIAGGISVTILGLLYLSGPSHSLRDGWRIMIERNQAQHGEWKKAADTSAQRITAGEEYNRLSVIQPVEHPTNPWPGLLVGFLSVSIWYNVINQFMIQRVLAAKNLYHARMGIILAGFIKIAMPAITVLPGLILFAINPDILLLPWERVRTEADKGYVSMLQIVIPAGFRGLFLAALFGAVQSTVSSVINSTSTIVTLDFYKRLFRPNAPEKHYVRFGALTSAIVMGIAIVLALYLEKLGDGLFVYIQTMYAFFAPPFAAIFLLGILSRRMNAEGATSAVFLGFGFGILLKFYVNYSPTHPRWLEPYTMQATVNWLFCVLVCVGVSLATAPPPPEKITDQLTMNLRTIGIGAEIGDAWYRSVLFYWLLFVAFIIGIVILLSGNFV